MEFTSPLHDITTQEHATVTLECAISKPEAQVIWLKQGVELQTGPKFETIDEGAVKKLVIHDVSPEEIADYTVKIGDLTSTATLGVEGMLSLNCY